MDSHINRPAKKLVILIAPQSGPYSWLVIAPCCQVRGQMLTMLLQHFLHSGEDSLPIWSLTPGLAWCGSLPTPPLCFQLLLVCNSPSLWRKRLTNQKACLLWCLSGRPASNSHWAPVIGWSKPGLLCWSVIGWLGGCRVESRSGEYKVHGEQCRFAREETSHVAEEW